MKRHVSTNLCLALAAMSLTTMVAEPAAAKNSVPLKGTFSAVEESVALFPPDVPFPTLFVEASGSGLATQLGRYTVNYEVEVNLDNFFGVGSAEFVAANGDSFFTDNEGQGTVPTETGFSIIVESHIITGGTGRFDGATGQFILVRVINVFTGVTSGVFDGTIVKAQ
jgi:hypothetical protein